MNTKNSNEARKYTEKDKWGYVVCFGTVLIFIAGIGHVNSFGLIYKDFIVDTHSSAKSLTTAHGVFSIMLAIGGLTLNVITKRCSLRLGGLIGAVIMSTGSFVTVFISSTNQLPFTFGVLQGVGFGMIVPVCYSTFNHYFVRKRTQVMSLIKATQGTILIFYPQLLKVLLSRYGFRSTLLLISGISLHTFPGVVAMNMSTKTNKNRTANVLTIENGTNNQETADLIDKHKDKKESQIDVATKNIKLSIFKRDVLEMLNVKILKDPVFCNICIGQSFVNFSDLIFFVLQPMLFYQYGLSTNQVAACISISAGADVAGRFGLAFISSIASINTRLLFYVATILTLAARIGTREYFTSQTILLNEFASNVYMWEASALTSYHPINKDVPPSDLVFWYHRVILQVRQFIWLAVVTSFLGVLRAWLHVASPLVISHHVTHEDFTGAYAVFMLSTGLVNIIFSPIIGLIKDVYQDYIPAFYALTACCLPCLFLWPAEYYLKYKLNK